MQMSEAKAKVTDSDPLCLENGPSFVLEATTRNLWRDKLAHPPSPPDPVRSVQTSHSSRPTP